VANFCGAEPLTPPSVPLLTQPLKNMSGNQSLAEHDPILFDLIEKEKFRQWSGLELIASENFTSKAVMECLGSCLTNKVIILLLDPPIPLFLSSLPQSLPPPLYR
jgi:hypothetical protein